MDPKNPARTPMKCSSMMQHMMEKMRSTDECSPAEMCQRIMASFRTTSTAEPPTSTEEGAAGQDREQRDGCCGQQAERTPKGT